MTQVPRNSRENGKNKKQKEKSPPTPALQGVPVHSGKRPRAKRKPQSSECWRGVSKQPGVLGVSRLSPAVRGLFVFLLHHEGETAAIAHRSHQETPEGAPAMLQVPYVHAARQQRTPAARSQSSNRGSKKPAECSIRRAVMFTSSSDNGLKRPPSNSKRRLT